MRPLHLAATGLLAAVLLPAAPTHAAGETCQGRSATIVGTPGQYGLAGTEGDDVVVTGGARGVATLGGNDLVCITSALPSIAGVGWKRDPATTSWMPRQPPDPSRSCSARVVTPTRARPSRTTWSPGRKARAYEPAVDVERDVITTVAGGDDQVISGADPAVVNEDAVVMAPVPTTARAGPG